MNAIEILQALAQAVEDSTIMVEVCEPDDDYRNKSPEEARGWNYLFMDVVCPHKLKSEIEKIVETLEGEL